MSFIDPSRSLTSADLYESISMNHFPYAKHQVCYETKFPPVSKGELNLPLAYYTMAAGPTLGRPAAFGMAPRVAFGSGRPTNKRQHFFGLLEIIFLNFFVKKYTILTYLL